MIHEHLWQLEKGGTHHHVRQTRCSTFTAASISPKRSHFAILKRCQAEIVTQRPSRRACAARVCVAAAGPAQLAADGGDVEADAECSSPFLEGRMQRMLAEIAVFAAPVLMVPLADPVMSLIDTVALGQLAGTLQLASLGPCALLLNFTFYTFNALSIATVSLTAERLRLGRGAEHAVSSALFVGGACGLVVTAVLLTFGPQLLAATGCDPVLLQAAREYLRIRALAAPAAITTQVAQAGLIGQRDSIQPFRIVLLSIAVSLLGDLLLIGAFGMGIAGAAWTTVAAQYLSAVLLVRALSRSRVRPVLELPRLAEVQALLSVASALGVFYLCKTTSYLMIQAATVRLPALLLAAHQPVWQLWGLCSFTNTPLEQAALAFIPAARSPQERRELTTLLLVLGAAGGVALTLVAHGVPAVSPGLLAADPQLWGPMRSVWVPGSIAMLLCGADVSSTGILLANKDTGYVARAMAVSMVVLAAYLWWARSNIAGLGAIWSALAVFFAVRASCSLPRVLLRHLWHDSSGTAAATAKAA